MKWEMTQCLACHGFDIESIKSSASRIPYIFFIFPSSISIHPHRGSPQKESCSLPDSHGFPMLQDTQQDGPGWSQVFCSIEHHDGQGISGGPSFGGSNFSSEEAGPSRRIEPWGVHTEPCVTPRTCPGRMDWMNLVLRRAQVPDDLGRFEGKTWANREPL